MFTQFSAHLIRGIRSSLRVWDAFLFPNHSPRNSYKPWLSKNDTEENNDRAKRAYEALLTLTVRPPPNTPEYMEFDDNVRKKALAEFNFTFGDEPVNPFVTAFYDAVLLYAMALNETLRDGGSISNGSEITRRMWGKSFKGIKFQRLLHIHEH